MGTVTTDAVQADSYTDKAGTGAPNFPNNLEIGGDEVAGVNKFQIKTLASDQGSAGNLTDLDFNNLVVGKVYRVTVSGRVNKAAGDGAAGIDIEHDGSTIGTATASADSTIMSAQSLFDQIIFMATATTLTFTLNSVSLTTLIEGDGTTRETNTILEELNDYKVTTDFT